MGTAGAIAGAGEFVGEAAGDDACGQCEEANAEQYGRAGDEFAGGGDGVSIAIAYGSEGNDAPPGSRRDAAKDLGLSVVLDGIHQGGGDDHEGEYEDERDGKLFAARGEHATEKASGVVVTAELEHTQEAKDAEEAEDDGVGIGEGGEVERE